MDEFDKKIKKCLNENLEPSEKYDEMINNVLENLPEQNRKKYNKGFFDRLTQIAAVGILAIGITTFAYTGMQKNEGSKKVEQYIKERNFSKETKVTNGEMRKEYETKRSNSIDYYKIETMADYQKYKEVYDLIDVTEEELENKFIFVILTFGESYISDIYSDDDTLYIKLIREFDKENYDELPTGKVISTKISKELNREDINIVNIQKGSEDIIDELLSDNYTMEKAIAEENVVIKSYHLMSNNKEKLKEFIEKTENGESDSIRIVNFTDSYIRVTDVRYINNVYVMYEYTYFTRIDPYYPHGNHADFYVGDYVFIVERFIEDISVDGYHDFCEFNMSSNIGQYYQRMLCEFVIE